MAPVFETTILGSGKTAAGIEVPDEIVAELGAGRRPAVTVMLNGYRYRSTIAVMGGTTLISVSNQVRADSGLAVGDVVRVELALDTAARVIIPPDDLVAAMTGAPGSRDAFDRLSYSNQQRHVLAIEGAKTPETRARRITSTIDLLLGR